MTDWAQTAKVITGPPIVAGTPVERTDVDGWGVGEVVAVTMTEARIRFNGPPVRTAWVKLTAVVHARKPEPVVFDQATVLEVERIMQQHIDKTHWAADAHRLKLALADIRKLAAS